MYAVGTCPYFKVFLHVLLCDLPNDGHTFLTSLDLYVHCSRCTVEVYMQVSLFLSRQIARNFLISGRR